MKWLERKKYRKGILDELQSLMLASEDVNYIPRAYPGIEDVIKTGFKDGTSPAEIVVQIAVSVFSKVIEDTHDLERYEHIARNIQQTFHDPNWAPNLREQMESGNIPADIDHLQWRVIRAILLVDDMYCVDRISREYSGYFISEVIGALLGQTREERRHPRLSKVLDEMSEPKLGAK